MKLSRHGPKKNKPCSSRILSIYCCSTTIHTRGRKDRINEGKGAEEDRGGGEKNIRGMLPPQEERHGADE